MLAPLPHYLHPPPFPCDFLRSLASPTRPSRADEPLDGDALEDEFVDAATDDFSRPVPLPRLTRMLDRLWEDEHTL